MCFNKLFALTAFFVFLFLSCDKSNENTKNIDEDNLSSDTETNSDIETNSDTETNSDIDTNLDADVNKDADISESDDDDVVEIIIEKDKLVGLAQKGPFVNGTSVSLFELNESLVQTGKVYNTQITANNGIFELTDVALESKFVSFRADGFYFNEVIGKKSDSQITLYAISDITDKESVNINILSNLERSRVEYLISHGKSFSEAKKQAQKDVLKIFNIEKDDDSIQNSEEMDISKTGDSNAILLAISSILQGYRSDSELTELLSNISQDIKEDGILDSEILGSDLVKHAKYLVASRILTNLQNRYTEIGLNPDFPDFEKYIENFLNTTEFESNESIILYPEEGSHGENLLYWNKTEYFSEQSKQFSLSANLPKGVDLKIKITLVSGEPWRQYGTISNWTLSDYDSNSKSQAFTSIDSGNKCEIAIDMNQPGNIYRIDYYEAGAEEPTHSKTVSFTQINHCEGVVCEALDQCHDAGVCNPVNGECSNPAKENNTTCDDNDACTQTDTCQNGVCIGSDDVVCAALDQCHDAGICDSLTGECSNPEKIDGTKCNDGEELTFNDKCFSGTCSGNIINCTIDSECQDDDLCNGSEFCHADGKCRPSTEPLDCDDNIRLTIDSCNSTTGCINTQVECIDETDCVEGEFYETPECNTSHECVHDIVCPANTFSITVPENWFRCRGYDKNWVITFTTFYTDGIYQAGDKILNPGNTCHLLCKNTLIIDPPYTECNWTSYPEENGYYKCQPPYYSEALYGGCSLWPGDHCVSQE